MPAQCLQCTHKTSSALYRRSIRDEHAGYMQERRNSLLGMNYTNYILNGHPFQPETFIAEGGFRIVTTITVMPVAIIGLPVMGCFLVAAYCIDGGRRVKLHYLLFKKEQRKIKYYKSVMISLGHSESEWYKLNAA